MPKSTGFTLIEVLVALAIVSITLIAGLQASAALTRNAQRQSQLLLAQICADNVINTYRLRRTLPDTGNSTQTCEQAGHALAVQLNITRSPNPNFNLVQVRVQDDGIGILQLITVIGRY
ncbi:type II secretion system minor pseudopilin GspI [Curvibacter sp. CHRR-16]|uniref:type II secretion system minor pseudopilin GspI n=1 Tax=Curvibacter sp. CHRR-16 TaxID=2835872 RepID=UPI001BD953A4|nr:type II secretion system minor pseudopilin GspI [Curvibacter sp. CHRR-16]MBT0569154.1 type II secretion system minor pseudopilin GspI [Curvibacter sp. CHRR-16]